MYVQHTLDNRFCRRTSRGWRSKHERFIHTESLSVVVIAFLYPEILRVQIMSHRSTILTEDFCGCLQPVLATVFTPALLLIPHQLDLLIINFYTFPGLFINNRKLSLYSNAAYNVLKIVSSLFFSRSSLFIVQNHLFLCHCWHCHRCVQCAW